IILFRHAPVFTYLHCGGRCFVPKFRPNRRLSVVERAVVVRPIASWPQADVSACGSVIESASQFKTTGRSRIEQTDERGKPNLARRASRSKEAMNRKPDKYVCQPARIGRKRWRVWRTSIALVVHHSVLEPERNSCHETRFCLPLPADAGIGQRV